MFSVIIPCHNDIGLLRLSLAGFAAQIDEPPFEVIIVDNNSFREDINAVFEAYVSRLTLSLLRQPLLAHPMAVCRARNAGLALCRFPWVINIDADCVPPPYYLANIRNGIETAAARNLIVAGIRRFVDQHDLREADILARQIDFRALRTVKSPSNYDQTEDRRLPEIRQIACSEHPWALIHSCNVMYRADTARAICGYDESFDGCWGYEDTDFAHRMITQAGASPVFLEGIEVYHLDSAISTTRNRFDKLQNRNWHEINARIPGLAQFKRQRYRKISTDIIV